MHAEIFKGKGTQPWRWHFKATNGKITADSEGFPTKAHAVRAAKAVVRRIVAPFIECVYDVCFESKEVDGITRITWS